MFITFKWVEIQRPHIKHILGKTIWAVLGMVLAVVLTGSVGLASTQAQTDDDPIARIEAALTSAVERDNFSGAVLIARDGEILLNQGYGYAVREWEVPNTSDSVFRIASITKQFTAMAILIFQERGLLTVQDHVCQYFEDCPESWADITIDHLLTHTSGIPDYVFFPDYRRTQMIPLRPMDSIERFIHEPLDFPPGEEWSYSNSGYVVLGYILEEVSGDSYQTVLRDNVFEALGMENTAYRSTDTQLIEHRAEGYASPRRRANYLDMSIHYAAGGIQSTVGDLYLWDQALFGGEVVSQESWDAMVEAAYTFPDGVQYAYGVVINNVADYPFIGHGGGVDGFASGIAHFTEENTTIIVLENLEADPWLYIDLFASILFDD